VLENAIPAFGRLRQEDHEFKASFGYIVRPCLKIKPAGHQWFTPEILATQEAEIRRPYLEKPFTKIRAGGWLKV
jgi:hypothetical protein